MKGQPIANVLNSKNCCNSVNNMQIETQELDNVKVHIKTIDTEDNEPNSKMPIARNHHDIGTQTLCNNSYILNTQYFHIKQQTILPQINL